MSQRFRDCNGKSIYNVSGAGCHTPSNLYDQKNQVDSILEYMSQGLDKLRGIQGLMGDIGFQGIQGFVGGEGPTGIQGDTGNDGIQGIQGLVGPRGPQGPAGSGGGGGSLNKTTLSFTTNSVAIGDIQLVILPSSGYYSIYSISTSSPAWVRVYGSYYTCTSDDRIAPGGSFPIPGSGFFAEVNHFGKNLSTHLSPVAEVQVETSYTYFLVKNTGNSAASITVDLEIVEIFEGVQQSPPPYSCNSLVNTSGETDLSQAWKNCTNITSLPYYDLSSVTNLSSAWEGCSNLAAVGSGMFDECPCINYQNAFVDCSLSSQSVDNIIVSIDNSGTEGGVLDLAGGGNNPPSIVGESALASLEAKGWTVSVVEGGTPSYFYLDDYAYSLSSFGDGRAVAGSYYGYTYTSTDYGASFPDYTYLDSGDEIYSIAACDGQTVVAGTWAASYPYISTDSGTTWTPGPDFDESEIDSVAYAGNGVIYIGTYGYIHKSTDNGVTWSSSIEPVPNGDYYMCFAFPGPDKIVAGTYSDGYVVVSDDGGSTWTQVNIPNLDGYTAWSMATDGNGSVVMGSDAGFVFTSHDNGLTWNSGTTLGDATEIQSVVCSETGVFYAGTDDNGYIYRSVDQGDSWELYYDPDYSGSYVYSMTLSGNGYIIAGVYDYVYAIPYTLLPISYSIPETQLYPTFSSSPDLSKYVKTDTTGIANSSSVANIVQLSQGDYDALGTYDFQTLYVIVG